MTRGLLGGLVTLVLAVPGAAPAVAADGEVSIPDPVFQACVRNALEGRPLTAQNLAALTRGLSCEHRDPAVTDLTGAEYLTGLTGLTLRGNAISDLSPVRDLPNLKVVWFDGNQVTDLSPLTGMGLVSVGLGGNPVASLAPLATLPDLISVHLEGGSPAELDPLAEIPKLGILHIQGRPADGYGVLHSLAALTNLTVVDNGLRSLDELDLPASLTRLFVQSSGLESIAGVEASPDLTSLDVSNSSVSDLAPLQPLAKLISLYVHMGQIEDLTALADKTALTTLSLDGHRITDITPLAGLAALTRLSLGGNDITDITPLGGLAALTNLSLGANDITDITPLGGLAALTDLSLDGNRIRDFSPLDGWAGVLSARRQTIALPALPLDTPTPFALRGVDGTFLTLSTPNPLCDYTAGMLTCSGDPGWLSFHSGPTAGASPITLDVAVDVTGQEFSKPALPAPGGGNVHVGQPVTAPAGIWSPTPTSLSYQWIGSNGLPVQGATSATYTPTGEEAGALRVEVTAHRPTYFPATAASDWSTVHAGTFTSTHTPTISYNGRLATDTVLTANPGTWEPAATLSFQWQNNNANIPGATSATYKLKASDVGDKVRVRVTATKPGYTPVTRYSTTLTPARAVFANIAPMIRGTRAVGKTLTAQTEWPAGTTLKYRWYRNDKAITGATRATYTLKASDLGDRFKVRVTASKAGYTTMIRTSASTSKVTRGTLTTAPVYIKGTATAGHTLTAIRGTWGPGTVSYSYRWYRDNTAITGATGKTYTVKKADRGHTLKVRVTVTKTGYATIRKTSPGVQVP